MTALLLLCAATGSMLAQSPVWQWANTGSDGGTEHVRDIAVDPTSGAIYATGTYQTTNTGQNPFSLPDTYNGTQDAFLVRMDQAGNVTWSVRIGSLEKDEGYGVAVNTSGTVFVSGSFGGDLPAPWSRAHVSGDDAFFMAYTPTGSFMWAKYVQSSNEDIATDVVTQGAKAYVYGTFTNTSITGILSVIGLTSARQNAYLHAYSNDGTLEWSLIGMSSDNIQTERLAADASNVYVCGKTEGVSIGWRNVLFITTATASTGDDDALFVSAINLAGVPQWSRMINNPGGSEADLNGIAVNCNSVLITGNTANGSTFPGQGATTLPGAPTPNDYLYLAALNTSNGATQWVRTAGSSINDGCEGYDVAVGRSNQIYVTGCLSGAVTTDAGVSVSGSNKDLFVARFESTGSATWYKREIDTSNEEALAVELSGNGTLLVGGRYSSGITLPPLAVPLVGGSDNLFLGKLLDPLGNSSTTNVARFQQPGPYCHPVGTVDLNAYLASYAQGVSSSTLVADPGHAIGAPNGIGAQFNSTASSMVLNLNDTLITGDQLALTWRSQTNGVEARLMVETSVDGSTWSTVNTLSTSSNGWTTTNATVYNHTRFVRLTRHPSYTALLVDAVRYFTTTTTGGTWSGANVTGAGSFTPPNGGQYNVTYTVTSGACTFSCTRRITVNTAPVGGMVSGGGQVCPNQAVVLALNGHVGSILRWEHSTDGNTWTAVANTTSLLSATHTSGNHHYRAVVTQATCGEEFSSTAVVQVTSGAPSLTGCASDMSVQATSLCGAQVLFPAPLVATTCNTCVMHPNLAAYTSLGSHGGHEYYLSTSDHSYAEAMQMATDMGYHLASVNSAAENTFLNDAADALGVDEFWIGLNDLANEGTFTWTDGTPLGFSSWEPGQPADNSGLDDAVVFDDGEWHIDDPAESTLFVVEVPCANTTLRQVSGLPSGSQFPIGNTLVKFYSVDANANSASCAFNVEVQAPVVPLFGTCPGNSTVQATNGCATDLAYERPKPISACGACQDTSVFAAYICLGSYNGHRYYASGWDASYDQARVEAAALGYPLLAIHTEAENDFVANAKNAQGIGDIHLGLDDEASEGAFGWHSTAPLTYTRWAVGEPDDNLGTADGAMMDAMGAWFDIPVGQPLPYVLEVPCAPITVSLVQGPDSATSADVGPHDILWVAAHPSGLVDSCAFNITVEDKAPPAIANCPPDQNVPASDYCDGAATWTAPTASDACTTASIMQTAGPSPGYTSFPVGATTIEYTATDLALNDSTCTFTITVVDTTSPSITCPPNTTYTPSVGECDLTWNYATPMVTDNCGGPWPMAFVSGNLPGDPFPVGTTTTTYSTSVAGTNFDCVFTVTVENIGSSVYCPLTDSLQLFLDADCRLVWPDLRDSITVTDCDPTVNIMWPPADTVFTQPMVVRMTMDIYDTDAHHAENDHWIWIRDTIAPVIACLPNDTVAIEAGQCDVLVNYATTAVDACMGNVLVTFSPPSGSSFTAGDHIITATANDGQGNTRTCSFILTVKNTTVELSYGTTRVCKNGPILLPTLATPANGEFSDSAQNGPGTPVDPVTGAFNPALANVGFHPIGYVFPGACTGHDWFTIEVVAAPNAGVNNGLTICSTAAPESMFNALGGAQAGGDWNGPSNVVGGMYDPAEMLPGIYTYTVAGTAPCSSAYATVTVHETTAPTSSFSYNAAGYCTNQGGNAIPLITGTTGGTFDITPALTAFDTITGSFDIGNANSTYTVNYSVPATGSCGVSSSTATVNVIAAPWAGDDVTATVCITSPPFDLDTMVTGSPSSSGTWIKPFASNAEVPNGIVSPSAYSGGMVRTYAYVVTGTTPCANDTSFATITYVAPATVGTSQPAIICSGGTVVLADLLSGETPGGTWRNSANAIVTGAVSPTSTSTYTYTVGSPAPCPAVSASVTVTVVQPSTTGTPQPATLCLGASVALADLLNGETPGGTWTNSGNQVVTGSVSPTSTSTYTYTIGSNAPCTAVSANVTVSLVQPATTGTPQPATICNGASVVLADLLSGETPGGNWTNSGNQVVTGSVSPVATSTYTYTVSGAAPCDAATASVTVTVNSTDTDGDGVPNCSDDCPNVVGQVGSTCNDGNACTINDALNALCLCVGSPVDPDDNNPCTLDSCDPVTGVSNIFQDADGDGTCDTNDQCPGGPEPGTACNDNNAATLGDVIGANCICAGVLNCTPGAPCNDLNACTTGEVFDANCDCGGGTPVNPDDNNPCTLDSCDPVTGVSNVFQDADGDGVCDANDQCPGGPEPGTACNDNNDCTTGDVIDINCTCTGTSISTATSITHTACINYTWFDSIYTTSGTYIHVEGCGSDTLHLSILPDSDSDGVCDDADLCANGPEPGTSCDDDDDDTVDDVITSDCVCLGQPVNPCVSPQILEVTGNGPVCEGSSLTLSVSVTGTAPFIYAWTGPGTFNPDMASSSVEVSAAESTSYSVSVTNACGAAQASYIAAVIALPDAGADATVTVPEGATVHLNTLLSVDSLSGSFDGPSTIIASGEQSFSFIVQTAGCGSDVAVITVIAEATVFAGNDIALDTCIGVAINLMNLLPGATSGGAWTDEQNITVDPQMILTANGSYTYSVGNDEAVVSISVISPTNAGTSQILAVCVNDPAVDMLSLLAGDAGGQWSGPSAATNNMFDPAVMLGGEYDYVTTNSCGSDTATITAVITTAASADWSTPAMVCEGSAPIDLNTMITGTMGGNWSGSGVQGHLFTPGGMIGPVSITYSVGTGSCAATSTQNILVQHSPVAQAGPDGSICGDAYGLQAIIDVVPGLWTPMDPVQTWLMDASDPLDTAHANIPGTYGFVWTVGTGLCTDADTVLITFHEVGANVWVNAGEDQSLGVVVTTGLNGHASPGTQVEWSVLSGNGFFANAQDTATEVTGLSIGENLFLLTATYGTGCGTASDTVRVTVDEIMIPQGISPNGDGQNDELRITGIGSFPGNTLQIFNRWGQEVYSAGPYDNTWNGTGANGQPMPDDTYFYVLNLTPDHTYNGFIVIKR